MPETLVYADAVAALERALQFGIHPSLDGIRALTQVLGCPQDAYSCIQVTGTNGKTSVTRLTAAILHAHGLRVGAYTSPHLVSYTERMQVDGAPIAPDAFARAVGSALAAAGTLGAMHGETLGINDGSCQAAVTEFELLTAAALEAFRDHDVAWACLEVGMGGRWDATSVVSPCVSVITGIGLDHTERLGMTRDEIAADKAHIIKPGSVAVVGPGCTGVEHLILDRARAVGAPIVRVGKVSADVTWRVLAVPDVPGGTTRLAVDGAFMTYEELAITAPSYQALNVAVAIATAEAALAQPLDADAVRDALAVMAFPGRFECLRAEPPLVIDGAHNPQAALVLADAVREAFGDRKPVFVLGVMGDKDVGGIVEALLPVAGGFVCTQSRSDRALEAATLAEVVRGYGGVVLGTEGTVKAALHRAGLMFAPGIVCAGSIYVAGEVRALSASAM